MSSIFQWLIYFLLRSEASNKAKPTITRWNKEIRTAYGNSLLPAIFYYEAKRVTKQSRLTPHRSQRYVSLTQAANYRLFFIKYSTEAYLSWRKPKTAPAVSLPTEERDDWPSESHVRDRSVRPFPARIVPKGERQAPFAPSRARRAIGR